MAEGEFYQNPKSKGMCNICNDKESCEQTEGDIQFCKQNQIAWQNKQVLDCELKVLDELKEIKKLLQSFMSK